MPITPTLSVSPTLMLANWTAGLQSPTNQQKLVHKYLNPKRLFNADPAGAQVAFAAGVQRAIATNKYATNFGAADPNKAAANMQQYGGTNWSTAGTAKAYKYGNKTTALANAINTVLATVNSMPRGRGPNNQARMLAWFNGMSAYYGKI